MDRHVYVDSNFDSAQVDSKSKQWKRKIWKQVYCCTIRWAAWMRTGAWFGDEVVSVVIIVAFEPVKGETMWNTKNRNMYFVFHVCLMDEYLVVE